MRRLLLGLGALSLALGLSWSSGSATTAIVNNHAVAGKAEDSLCVTFFVTDSIGNFGGADSFYVVVFSPWGDSVFGAAYIGSATEIRTATVGGRKMYRWMKDVADIDGTNPRSGTYSGIIVAVDTLDGASSARLDQAFPFSFVLEPSLGERVRIGDTLLDGGITAAKLSTNAITASAMASDAWIENWASPTRTLTTDSFVVDMSSFNAALDNDTTLVNFLRAARGSSGTYSCTLVAFDTASHQVIPGATLVVRNAQQTALFAVGGSGPDGRMNLNLNSGSYSVLATSPGYLFSSPAGVVISGAQTDTIRGYHFDPGMPASPNLCRVYGYVYGLDRQPEVGVRVSASVPAGVSRSGNLLISPFAVTTTTDTQGYFAVDLIPSDSLAPSSAKYEFSITRSDGAILRQRVKVPAVSSWQLTW